MADEKPNVKDEKAKNHITLVVKDQNGSDLQFKVKGITKFEKIFAAYCERKGIQPAGIKFLFDGERLLSTSTPEQEKMADNDVIDAVLEQTGG
mmetsp:Transcript_3510/g.10173  ORF Transcript_3510/g.10173 Transcript_3510/m.10173 type:complete len:93 (+) Transcript_3510:224-502(+)